MTFVNSSSHLIAAQNRRRRYSTDEPLQVTTLPSKWPGKQIFENFSHKIGYICVCNWYVNAIL